LSLLWPTTERFPAVEICPWLLEEYWALKEIDLLASGFPYTRWDGVVAFSGTWDALEIPRTPSGSFPMFQKSPSGRLFSPSSVPVSFAESEPHFLRLKKWVQLLPQNHPVVCLSTSHALSGPRAYFLGRKHPELRCIVVDAHLDLADEPYKSNRWIEDPSGTALISPEVSKQESELFAWVGSSLEDSFNSPQLHQFVEGHHIFASVDLDYFESMASYRHREVLIGHSMNVRQRLGVFSSHFPRNDAFLIGEEARIFAELGTYVRNLGNGVRDEGEALLDWFSKLIDLLSSASATLVGVDICEYSPLCDIQQFTAKELRKLTDFIAGEI